MIKQFIELCLQNPPKEWAELRKFDLEVLNKIGVGYCNNEVYSKLMQQDKEATIKSDLVVGKRFKYVNMPIIKVTDDYFIAKPKNKKNLFPSGTKHPWFIKGIDNQCFITEGETDAIRIKHEYPDSSVLSLGGVGSQKPLKEVGTYFGGGMIIIAFDNDEEGKKNSSLAANKLLGSNYKVLKLSFDTKFKDIDEYFREGGKKEDVKLEEITIIKETEKQHKKSRIEEIELLKLGVNEGSRNEACFILAKYYKKKYLDGHETFDLLKKWNLKNKPPLKEVEVENVINSVYEYAEKKKQTQTAMLIDNYTRNVEMFYEQQPFFYDEAGIFWFWKDNRYKQMDEVDVMNLLDDKLGFLGQTVNSKLKTHYIEAFKRVGRKKKPNNSPAKWIQFNDKVYSIESRNIYHVEPNFFFTNPIPWDIGESEDTPMIDKLVVEWVGEKYKQTIYELIAYCCYTDYPIQLLFCLIGCGRNGKGCFLKVLDKFLGNDNVTSTSLDLISGQNKSRFESFRLYKKLVALMGETNFGILNNTSLVKQLTGGDKIGFEKKGKDPFTGHNYAKIIIASNSLPTTQDTSDGFFRRWLIIEFNNEFPEGKDITQIIPDTEYPNLAKKVINILPKLLERGYFTNQGDIEERKQKYILSSNPLPLFIKQYCNIGDSEYILYNELYSAYIHLLRILKKRKVSRKEFKGSLEDEGYWIEKESKKIGGGDGEWKNGYYIDGLSLKLDILDNSTIFPTSSLYRGGEVGLYGELSEISKTSVKEAQNGLLLVNNTNITPNKVSKTNVEKFQNSTILDNSIDIIYKNKPILAVNIEQNKIYKTNIEENDQKQSISSKIEENNQKQSISSIFEENDKKHPEIPQENDQIEENNQKQSISSKIEEILKFLENQYGKIIPIETVIEMAQKAITAPNLKDNEGVPIIEQTIEKLKKEGEIVELPKGFIRLLE